MSAQYRIMGLDLLRSTVGEILKVTYNMIGCAGIHAALVIEKAFFVVSDLIIAKIWIKIQQCTTNDNNNFKKTSVKELEYKFKFEVLTDPSLENA